MTKFLVLVATLLLTVQQFSFAKAERSANIQRKTLISADISGTDDELRMFQVVLPPQFSAIEHTHPVVGACYVLEGTAESQYEGEGVKVFKAGDAFQDYDNKVHLVFRNPSKTEKLTFTCTTKIKKGQDYLVPK